eukprot:GHRQ01023814.1.p2 GENE.GHRQ01023814.1~~GHRQ01023814.1.p2  ORF type:complete len:122 (-),score=23.40 GHRQ01023814.1:261-626(-)
MQVPLIVAVSLALVATYVVKQVLAFWARLDKDSSEGLQLQIEDPSSVKPLLCPSIWGTATKRLTIVVPAYNEEDRLPATLDETLAYLQRRRNKEVSCACCCYCTAMCACNGLLACMWFFSS